MGVVKLIGNFSHLLANRSIFCIVFLQPRFFCQAIVLSGMQPLLEETGNVQCNVDTLEAVHAILSPKELVGQKSYNLAE